MCPYVLSLSLSLSHTHTHTHNILSLVPMLPMKQSVVNVTMAKANRGPGMAAMPIDVEGPRPTPAIQ